MDEKDLEIIMNMDRLQCPRCKGVGFAPGLGHFILCRSCGRVFRLIAGNKIQIAPRQFIRRDGWLDELDRKVGRPLTQEEVTRWKLHKELPKPLLPLQEP